MQLLEKYKENFDVLSEGVVKDLRRISPCIFGWQIWFDKFWEVDNVSSAFLRQILVD